MAQMQVNIVVEARLRRGAMPFLFFVNAFRKLCGLSMWVPDWLIVTEVKTRAA